MIYLYERDHPAKLIVAGKFFEDKIGWFSFIEEGYCRAAPLMFGFFNQSIQLLLQ